MEINRFSGAHSFHRGVSVLCIKRTTLKLVNTRHVCVDNSQMMSVRVLCFGSCQLNVCTFSPQTYRIVIRPANASSHSLRQITTRSVLQSKLQLDLYYRAGSVAGILNFCPEISFCTALRFNNFLSRIPHWFYQAVPLDSIFSYRHVMLYCRTGFLAPILFAYFIFNGLFFLTSRLCYFLSNIFY